MRDLMNRRDLLRQAGRALAGLSIVMLGACMPRETTRYEVKILLTQSRSHFNPPTLVVPKGAMVVWQNQAIYPQTVTFDPGQLKADVGQNVPQGVPSWDSGTLYPGQTWAYTFQTPGDYPYFSRFFEEPYLIGLVTVKG